MGPDGDDRAEGVAATCQASQPAHGIPLQSQASRPSISPTKLEDTVMGTIHARLAHVGVYAQDMPLLEKFYTTVLGLMVTDKGQGRTGIELTFMSGNPENHHQFVLVSGRPDTAGFNPIQQMSFMVDSLSELREVHNRALENGAT